MRPGWPAPIHQLLVQHRVSAVFHGHDHLYVNQQLDGIVYQEVPQPSAKNTKNGAMLAAAPEMQGVELPEPMDDSQPRGYPTIESSYAEGFNAYRDAIIRSAK